MQVHLWYVLREHTLYVILKKKRNIYIYIYIYIYSEIAEASPGHMPTNALLMWDVHHKLYPRGIQIGIAGFINIETSFTYAKLPEI